MANLTLKIESDLLKAARIRALEGGTSVNEVVRRFLVDYARTGRSEEERRAELRASLDRILAAAAASRSRIPGGRIRREEIYDRGRRRAR